MLVGMRLPDGDQQLVQIMEAALADAARRSGDWLACRPGCTQCCHGAFAINALDTVRLRTGMRALHAAEPARAEAIEERARAWIAEHGAAFPGDLATGLLGNSEDDEARFEGFANDAPCPALNPATGLCDVYEWRPMTCRVFGPPTRMGDGDALGCCELCFIGATESEIAACEMVVPREEEEGVLAEIEGSANSDSLGELSAGRESVVAFALLP
jgi:Fe-S-cluster containining protein